MRKWSLLASLLLVASVLAGQTPSGARVSFEQRWPGADPQWFELVIGADGSTKYRSQPLSKPDSAGVDPAAEPRELSFTLSDHARERVFAAGQKLPDFQRSLDKIKVAFSGNKTLRYEDGAGKSSAITYNYTSSQELTALTGLLVGISETIESRKTLEFQSRFDKLSLEVTLRSVEDLVGLQRLTERQLLEPVLTRIANDPTVMNIARQRARRILQAPAEK